MNERWFEFVPRVLFKVLAATLALLCVGWAGAIWLYGRLSTADMVGVRLAWRNHAPCLILRA